MLRWLAHFFKAETVTRWNWAHDEQNTFYPQHRYSIVCECPVCRVVSRQFLKVGGGRVCLYCMNSWHQADLATLNEEANHARE